MFYSPYIALQTRYNLLDRSLEFDLGPMARALGLGNAASSNLLLAYPLSINAIKHSGIIPWGSVAEGFLTGKVIIFQFYLRGVLYLINLH